MDEYTQKLLWKKIQEKPEFNIQKKNNDILLDHLGLYQSNLRKDIYEYVKLCKTC